jgi:hypothetical protein
MSIAKEANPADRLTEAGAFVKESIDRTLKDILGEGGARATFFHVGITNYDKNSKEFHIRMVSIFKGGTSTIERSIVKDLFKTLDIPFFEDAEFNYEKSIQLALNVAQKILAAQARRVL